MIDLHLPAEFDRPGSPFVVKVRADSSDDDVAPGDQEAIARKGRDIGIYDCQSANGAFSLRAKMDDPIDGDVLLCVPSRKVAHRLFRRASRHNTLLLTERCDQLCLMCSQPPKRSEDDWRFPFYEQALLLSEPGTIVGISGGEPTLYLDMLIEMLGRTAEKRPDLRYHILTNGQHFAAGDEQRLRELHKIVGITWGVPLYSQRSATHDEIVGKPGAFEKLLDNLFLLGSTRAAIELRTVITSLNALDLPHLANFIGRHLPFVADWAIMGMEPIGYARAHWERLFFDHSICPQPLLSAIEIADLKGVPCHLYNVPRCTVPKRYRAHCVDSISDWKKKFVSECSGCAERASCSGFFEWYNERSRWENISAIAEEGEYDETQGHVRDTNAPGSRVDAALAAGE